MFPLFVSNVHLRLLTVPHRLFDLATYVDAINCERQTIIFLNNIGDTVASHISLLGDSDFVILSTVKQAQQEYVCLYTVQKSQ